MGRVGGEAWLKPVSFAMFVSRRSFQDGIVRAAMLSIAGFWRAIGLAGASAHTVSLQTVHSGQALPPEAQDALYGHRRGLSRSTETDIKQEVFGYVTTSSSNAGKTDARDLQNTTPPER